MPEAPVSQVYTWEPSDAAIAQRYGLSPGDILRFDLNTSPRAPDHLAGVLAGPFEPPLNEYPDSLYADLADAASTYVGAEPWEVLVGAGADEVLDIIAKTFLAAGDRAVVPVPTYSMYGVLSSQRGALVDEVPRLPAADGFGLDLGALLPRLAGAGVAWLCSPNNPTAAPELVGSLTRVLDAAARLGSEGPVVVVDEAYFEFTGQTVIPLRSSYPGLVVVRTMSKAFALASMRVGYAVAARPTIERLERNRPPGSVATVSAAVAAGALRHPAAALENVARLSEERASLLAALAAIGLPAYPSITNFVLVRVGGSEAADDANEWLLRHGIVSRTFPPDGPMAGHLRFTVRTRDQDERLIAVLADWRGRRPG